MNLYEHKMNTSQGNQNMAQLIEQMGITDPRIKMIAEFMSQQKKSDTTIPEAEGAIDEFDHDQNGKLLHEMELLQEENEQLLEHLDTLAAALGACPDCWGEDKRCKECQGTGVPGSYMPDRKAFQAYVVPALKRVSIAKKKARMKKAQKVGN